MKQLSEGNLQGFRIARWAIANAIKERNEQKVAPRGFMKNPHTKSQSGPLTAADALSILDAKIMQHLKQQ